MMIRHNNIWPGGGLDSVRRAIVYNEGAFEFQNMNRTGLLSIILPAFNEQEVLAQTHQRFSGVGTKLIKRSGIHKPGRRKQRQDKEQGLGPAPQ